MPITTMEWWVMTAIEYSESLRAANPSNAISIAKRKALRGVGINDADYVTETVGSDRCPAYQICASIIQRGYDKSFHKAHPTYSCVSVSPEWHSFMAFRDWWISNHKEGYQIDKDLLFIGNNEYSPEKCLMIPCWLNHFTINKRAARGPHPLGVVLNKRRGKFMARCSHPISGENEFLGYFTSSDAASAAWLKRKLEIAEEIRPIIDEVDERLYANVIKIITTAT
jgi:hypothetical protein